MTKLRVNKLLTMTTLALAMPAAVAGAAVAEAGRATYTLEFRYNPSLSAEANYGAFENKAQRECIAPGVRPLAFVIEERACVADIMDRLVTAMGHADLARIHAARTGTPLAPLRDFASRG